MTENAVFYARVSTKSKKQSESLENQAYLRDSYLKRHPEIRCVASYTERISGKSDIRPQYQEMLQKAKQDDIKYIMVKDTKRLFRSSQVAFDFKQFLQKYQLKLILLSTGEIYDPNKEEESEAIMYGIDSVLSEQVVRRQSKYGQVAHQIKCDRKYLNRNNVTFGYYWDEETKEIRICEEEAEIIRKMFDLYVFQEYGNKELRKFFAESGYPRSTSTIFKYLKETAYIGIFHLNKKGSELRIGAAAKTKRYDRPKEEWIPVERPDLAIVNKEIFELAQKVKESRAKVYDCDKNGRVQTRFCGYHIFSSKIFCGTCGYSYIHGYTSQGDEDKKSYYNDSFRQKSKDLTKKCSNPYRRLYEKDLIDITKKSVNLLIKKNQECFALILPAIRKALECNDQNKKEIIRLNKQIKALQREQKKVKDIYLESRGAIREALEQDYEELNSRVESLKNNLEEINRSKLKENQFNERLQKISDRIDTFRGKGIDKVDRQVANIFIHRITMNENGVMELYLKNPDSEVHPWTNALQVIPETDELMEHIDLESEYPSYRSESNNNTRKNGVAMFSFDVDYEDEKKWWNSSPRRFHVEVGFRI